jgi:hypothetical protein
MVGCLFPHDEKPQRSPPLLPTSPKTLKSHQLLGPPYQFTWVLLASNSGPLLSMLLGAFLTVLMGLFCVYLLESLEHMFTN